MGVLTSSPRFVATGAAPFDPLDSNNIIAARVFERDGRPTDPLDADNIIAIRIFR